MINVHPAWWPRVEQEIHASVKGFVEKIRIKLGDNPRLIVERENPFFSVLGRLEILVHWQA